MFVAFSSPLPPGVHQRHSIHLTAFKTQQRERSQVRQTDNDTEWEREQKWEESGEKRSWEVR